MGVDVAKSYWLKSAKRPRLPKCEAPQTVDVAVVGAGIVGIVTAYELCKRGRRPVVFETNRALGSVTGHTTAKVTSQHGIRHAEIASTHGKEKARAYADANQASVEWLFETCAVEDIECGLERDTACTYSMDEGAEARFALEREACRELGLPVADARPAEFLHTVVFERQARFHPVEFLSALIARVLARGGIVYEDSPITEIKEKDGGVTLQCNGHEVACKEAVVATHYPVYDSAFFIAKLAPYRSYAMAIEPTSVPTPGMYISDGDDLRSWRPHGKLMIVGAGCHKVGQQPDTESEYKVLEAWAKDRFGPLRVLAKWSAQDNATHDQLPYVGLSPGQLHIYVATGFDGWGMSNGIVSAQLIATQIAGEVEGALAEALDPKRLSLKGLGKLASENANAVGHLTTDRFREVRLGSPEDLRPGEAGVFAGSGLERIAAFRDGEGVLHQLDATCPHFKCQVGWNPAERTWDCPCHGSRFAATGEVIQAPATTGLSRLKAKRPGA